jgi:hypothetical protein
MSWILEENSGQLLAIGGQQRNIQLYDLRMSGSTSATLQPSPISAFSHSSGVHGIESDPTRPWHFCTFARSVGEVVKIWDARRIESPLSEIKPIGTKNTAATINSAIWSTLSPGYLSILVGEDTLSTYDTSSTGSRPILTSTIHSGKPIESFTHYPYTKVNIHDVKEASSLDRSLWQKQWVMADLFSKQIVAVESDLTVNVVACHRLAPIELSPRTGQLIFSVGQSLLLGSTSDGPSAMEGSHIQVSDDVSTTMLRRAQGLPIAKYSMDIASNIEMLTEESLQCSGSIASSCERLIRLWKWIQLAEGFCQDDVPSWPAKGLNEAGVVNLLKLDQGKPEQSCYSDSLSCFTFDSEGRRYVFNNRSTFQSSLLRPG